MGRWMRRDGKGGEVIGIGNRERVGGRAGEEDWEEREAYIQFICN